VNGTKNTVMHTAPADVDFECFADIRIGGIGIVIEETFYGNDHAGCAETALRGLFVQEGLLDRMKCSRITQPLQCNEFRLSDVPHRHLTRRNGRTIDQDLARTALFKSAAKASSRQLQLVPENGQKRRRWRGGNRQALSIY
jgi:hypothetical protein